MRKKVLMRTAGPYVVGAVTTTPHQTNTTMETTVTQWIRNWKSVAQWLKDWNRDYVSIGLPAISRSEKLEMMRMRNLIIIADRNNWPSDLAMSIFPSNR